MARSNAIVAAGPDPTFAYSPLLKHGEIRLLSIRGGAYDDVIHVDMVSADLASSSPKYEALSYVWGDGAKPCTIRIGPSGQTLPVTVNADAALRRLRHDVNPEPRLVWVDAICIDQTNIPERNAQVAMMARIYKQAVRVVVDLGVATPEVELAIRYLQEISHRNPATDVMSPYQQGRPLRVADPNCPVWYSGKKTQAEEKAMWMGPFRRPSVAQNIQAVWIDEDTPVSISPRFPTREEAQSLTKFFEHYTWFARAWVVQEMYHAAKVTVICAPHSFEWDAFEWFVEKWYQARHNMGMPPLPYALMVRNPTKLEKKCLWSVVTGPFRSCASTDPRDKVYAAISMVADWQPHIVPIDYAADAAMVFSRVGAALFYQVGLHLLWAIRGRSAIPGLPTWVPDWTLFAKGVDRSHGMDVMRPFRPAGGPPDWTVAELGPAPGHAKLALKVRGVRVGQIQWLGDVWDPKAEDWKDVVRRWRVLVQSRQAICPYPRAKPIHPALSTPHPGSGRVSLQQHASRAQFPTQANGRYRAMEGSDMLGTLASAGSSEGADPEKTNKEREEKEGNSLIWKCNFDSETVFLFEWPRGSEGKFFQDVNLTNKQPSSGCEDFYRTVIADGAHCLGAQWQFGAYYLFGQRLWGLSAEPGQGPPPEEKNEEQRREQLALFEEAARRAMAGRRLFITEEGYIGLAPQEAAVGDAVVVFLGDMNVSVLRQKSRPSNFEFVGQSYVPGADSGEAVRHIHISRILAKVPEAPLEDFFIL